MDSASYINTSKIKKDFASFFDAKTNGVILSTALITIAAIGAIYAALNTQAVVSALSWIFTALTSPQAGAVYYLLFMAGLLGGAGYLMHHIGQQEKLDRQRPYHRVPLKTLQEEKTRLDEEIKALKVIYQDELRKELSSQTETSQPMSSVITPNMSYQVGRVPNYQYRVATLKSDIEVKERRYFDISAEIELRESATSKQ